jgi:hypothetical protein
MFVPDVCHTLVNAIGLLTVPRPPVVLGHNGQISREETLNILQKLGSIWSMSNDYLLLTL